MPGYFSMYAGAPRICAC